MAYNGIINNTTYIPIQIQDENGNPKIVLIDPSHLA